ncbi:hypothetical protein M885DRAFT_516932 [Pelagophyceae sp. CCMP2097]|nr:hypothetical protein M885DRAFT_516932 [Pelagophyceae sp. CCMP2097]
MQPSSRRGAVVAACLTLRGVGALGPQRVAPAASVAVRRSGASHSLTVLSAEPQSAEDEECVHAKQELDERRLRQYMKDVDIEDLEESDTDLDGIDVMEPPEEDLTEEEPGWGGEFDGINDANDVSWRKEGEVIILAAFEAVDDIQVKDIHWDYGTLRVTLVTDSGEAPVAEAIIEATKVLTAALDDPKHSSLRIAERHSIEVSSPGASDVLTMQREFDAFKGFPVEVLTRNPVEGGEARTLMGNLVEKNAINLILNVKGRMVQIPFHLVDEVRLPKARTE